MPLLQVWIVVVSWIQTGILCQASCGDKQTVIGAEGGDVLLSVHQIGVKDVSWVTVNGGNHFASTQPGGILLIRHNHYEGRLYGTTDGSLNLTKLTREDQGEYRADIIRNPGNRQCDQLYNLNVFRRLSDKDIGITLVNDTGNGTCPEALLCAVNGSGVTISWRRSHSREIPEINGFLRVPDTETNHSFTCIARNPVSSASRAVTPQEYCQQRTTDKENDRPNEAQSFGIYAAVPLCVIIAVALICFACWRERNKPGRNETQLLQNATIYAENLPGENGNGGCAQPDQRESNTLYSEVQQVKNPPPKKEERAVYDTIKK